MLYQQHTLANGLRIIHKPTNSTVAYCGFAINAGTRDEDSVENGMAHFVEHMIFKGTTKRRSWHIINRMEAVGGEINAYTSKEETLVYSLFLEEDYERACELLCDLVNNSVFPQNEIEKEVDVIVDEINSYKDNPPELIYDEFENMIFKGHSLGSNILGSEETLGSFDSETGINFMKRWYRPENMIFFSLGKTDFRKVIRLVEKYFSSDNQQWLGSRRLSPSGYEPSSLTENRDTHQAHVIIGNRAFDMFDENRITLALLNNILGGPGLNSRLNISLREKRGLVYNVESNYTPYTDTGIFSVYFGSDQKNSDKCVSLIMKEFDKLRTEKMSTTQLEAAKKQIKGQIGISADNGESVAMGMAKSFLHYGKYDSVEEAYARIESVTASGIMEVANKVLNNDTLSILKFR